MYQCIISNKSILVVKLFILYYINFKEKKKKMTWKYVITSNGGQTTDGKLQSSLAPTQSKPHKGHSVHPTMDTKKTTKYPHKETNRFAFDSFFFFFSLCDLSRCVVPKCSHHVTPTNAVLKRTASTNSTRTRAEKMYVGLALSPCQRKDCIPHQFMWSSTSVYRQSPPSPTCPTSLPSTCIKSNYTFIITSLL
jgi:hypothetical protein